MTTEAKEKLFTVEEFLQLQEGGRRYELIEGELVEMPGPNVLHGRIIRRLFHHLDTFLTENPLGEALNNLAFELTETNAPIPDLAFIKAERLAGIDESNAFPGAPDSAIEVMSPSDKWSEVSNKVHRYQKAKTPLVWVVDPFDQGVIVYRLDGSKRFLMLEDKLDGEDVIPGFKLKVAELFK